MIIIIFNIKIQNKAKHNKKQNQKMTYDEKIKIKQIKEELVVIRLQTRVITESEFKKSLDKVLKMIENLIELE